MMASPSPICARFRTKAMVDRSDRLVRTREALEFPYCWCTRTLTDIGPDEDLVTLRRCHGAQRPCFERVASPERT